MASIPVDVRQQAESRNVACTLLIHPDPSVLLGAGQDVRTWSGVRLIAIAKTLAESLMPIPPQSRGRAASEWLINLVNQSQEQVIALYGIDLLFDPTMNMDPLALIRQLSRIKPLIVFWPGAIEENVLVYARPDHHHYRKWASPDVQMVQLNSQ